MRDIVYWNRSCGLWCDAYGSANTCADEYGFANKHRAANCADDEYFDSDIDEHARTNEYCDGDT